MAWQQEGCENSSIVTGHRGLVKFENMLFFTHSNAGAHIGSYRIPFVGLRRTFEQLGFQCREERNVEQAEHYMLAKAVHIIFFLKHSYVNLSLIDRCQLQHSCVSVLFKPHAATRSVKRYYDIIVYDSPIHFLTQFSPQPSHVMRLLEEFPKHRQQKMTLKKEHSIPALCFTGWKEHLKKLEDRLIPITRELNSLMTHDLILVMSTNMNSSRLLPRLSNAQTIRKIDVFRFKSLWNVQRLLSDRCTCGMVPMLSAEKGKQPSESGPLTLRMKSSANAGRAYLFAQLGIPFVVDPEPETISFLSKAGVDIRNFVGLDAEQWLQVILRWLLRSKSALRDLYFITQFAKQHLNVGAEANRLLCATRKLRAELIQNDQMMCLSISNDTADAFMYRSLAANADKLKNHVGAWLWEPNYFAWRTRSLLYAMGIHVRSSFTSCKDNSLSKLRNVS